MTELSDTIRFGGCARCGGVLAAGAFARLSAGGLDVLCSLDCLAGRQLEERAKRRAFWLRAARALSLGGVFVVACLAPPRWAPWLRAARVTPPLPVPAADKAPRETLPVGWFGPEWPPTETSLLAALGRDAWLHPLAGPVRRMPRSDTRVFGAERPGNRAWECRNGHCGVDLGGELWGEHVHAAHDGIVEKVQRAANPEHGGRYVRLAHHDGTVFTQYFHLAAIPRGLEPGVSVKAGDVVGLLGDSGVKESQPHLHFTVSIRTSADHEKYIDPEPLIALWPLRVPVEGTEAGLVTIVAPPGVPLGSMPRLHARGRKADDGRKVGPDEGGPAPASEEPERSEGPPAPGDAPAPDPTVED